MSVFKTVEKTWSLGIRSARRARWTEVRDKEFYFIVTCADEERASQERTIECFRGYAGCMEGAKEMGIIYGTGVYEKGKIKTHRLFRKRM